eukprot:s728_g7.t1
MNTEMQWIQVDAHAFARYSWLGQCERSYVTKPSKGPYFCLAVVLIIWVPSCHLVQGFLDLRLQGLRASWEGL